ncbi:hypothetical protein DFH09DRAFT_1194550, partial [Mycena vulgaris]
RGGKEGARKAHVQDQRGQSWRTWKRITRDPAGRNDRGRIQRESGVFPLCWQIPAARGRSSRFHSRPSVRLRALALIRRSPRAVLLLPPFPYVARPHPPLVSIAQHLPTRTCVSLIASPSTRTPTHPPHLHPFLISHPRSPSRIARASRLPSSHPIPSRTRGSGDDDTGRA